MTEDDSAALAAIMCLAADAARVETLKWFRTDGLPTDNKDATGAFDPVTMGDRAAERAIRAVLEQQRPDDAILGEEEAAKPGVSGLTWVIDPIDGTRAYMCGAPTWGTLIAVNTGAAPLMGMIDQPFIGERFIGLGPTASWQRDGSATRAITTRACSDLSQATVLTTFPEVGTEAEQEGFQAVSRRCRLTRYGMDCYGYALVAAGQVDLVIEAGLQTYDIQGPMAVVTGAGGVVTDWRGGPAHRGGQVIAAGDASLHAKAMEILAPFASG